MSAIPEEYKLCLIPGSMDIAGALDRINRLKDVPLNLFVVGTEGVLSGSLTDGDIRRGLLGGRTLADSVETVMKRDCHRLINGEDNLGRFTAARNLGIKLLPEVDAAGRLTAIVDLRKMQSMLPLDAVLMAGGRGERLRPLTLTTPKPLLPVGDKPIIDHNVDALARFGVRRIFVTVNYLKEQIEAHFASRAASAVECVREDRPLGTFGSIGLVKGLRHDNVLVMNSDLLTTLNFEKMYRHHLSSGATLTMAVVPYTVSVPYAILDVDDDRVLGFEEKPTYNYFANAGVYIVRREALGSVNGTERVDATDFIDSLLTRGEKVSYFPIDGIWIDIGSPDDYRMACRKLAQ